MTAIATDFEDDVATEAPELGEWSITPHDFQVSAFSATVRALEDDGCPSALVVMPTGAGKTIWFMMLARWVVESGGRVLVLAHTGELVEQARNKAVYVGLKAALEQAGEHARPDFTRPSGPSWFAGCDAPDPKLVVATVQTLRGRRLASWPPGHFDLIVVDEGHHAAAATYQDVINHLQPRWTVGVTATWDRGDGEPLVGRGRPFERLTYEVFMHDLVRRGFLKRPVAKVLDTSIDLKALRVTNAKDLNEHEIEQLLLPHVSEIVNELRTRLDGRRAVIFTPMVASADAVASAFSSLGVSCLSVSGVDPDRVSKLAAFRHGEYQHVACSALLTEGWDEPFVDACVILRPTKSRALYVQMSGRCLRFHEGKPEGHIWGVNWKTHGHDLVHPVEIFDSPGLKIHRETVAGAKALVDSGEELDLASALKRAQSERKERRKIELKVKEQSAKAKVYEWDMVGGPVEPRPGESPQAHERMATPNMVAALVRKGIDERSAHGWSFRRAGAFLGEQAARREAGLCTYKQQQELKRLGFPGPASKLSFADASAAIDGLRSSR